PENGVAMTTITDRAMLRQVPLFAGLNEVDFERLYQMAEPVTVAAGEVLIREGDHGDAMYAILDGEFEITQGAGQQELLLGRRGPHPPTLDPLERGDREDAAQGWLAGRGVADAWELAPPLVAAGWDERALEELAADFPGAGLAAVARWLGAGSAACALVDEVQRSAAAISEIVRAVKSYTYLDQAPVQEVDVHDGLENTLVILRHKLKQGVILRRDYAADLP